MISKPVLARIAFVLSIASIAPGAGDAPPRAIEVTFHCPVAEVAGTLLLPFAPEKVPCVVIVGGSLSHTRDGALVGRPAPPRDALKRLAEVLAKAGYASLRFDRVGHGESKPLGAWKGTYTDESVVAAAAICFARARPEVSKVIVAGESAGAYFACLAAKDGTPADGYIFLGGLCSSAEEMYEYNFGRLVKYAESAPARLEWATKNLRHELALGRNYRKMFAAAASGAAQFDLVDGEYESRVDLARRSEELRMPPDRMFWNIKSPALALSGERDLNVPPAHAARIVAILKESGVADATSATIAGADHSFQATPENEDVRIRERYTFESFRRPYAPRLDEQIAAWLESRFPTTTPPAPPKTRVRF